MFYPKPVRIHKKHSGIGAAQRERLLKRAGGRCEHCRELPDFRGLEIHHLTPKGMGGTHEEYEDNELEVVCGKCSAKYHGIRET
jgi:5-methylcytosine-specific restriction endonuclease McrA